MLNIKYFNSTDFAYLDLSAAADCQRLTLTIL